MKKKLIMMIVLTLAITTALVPIVNADDMASNDVTEEKTFSLEEAIDYALKNSPLIAISDTGIKKAKVSMSEANSAYKKAEDADDVSLQNHLTKYGYYKRSAQMAEKIAEYEKAQTVETIKYTVENNYFTLLNAQENLDIQSSILNLAKENMDIANLKYDLGTISEMDLLSFKTSLVQAEVDLKSAQRALKYAQMNFNKALTLPLKTKVKLTDTIHIKAPKNVDIEEKVAEALENRMEIISAKEQYEVDKLYFKIIAKWYTSNTYKYQSTKKAAESSEYTLNNASQNVEISVRKAYMDMLNAYESLDVLAQTENQLEKAYDITKTKYKKGMGTNTEMLEALNKLREIKLSKAKAQLKYNLAKKEFETSYGVGNARIVSY